MKKGLSTILVFLNLLVSPWLGCYANAKEDITTKTTISCLENKIDEKSKKGTGIEEKTKVSFNNTPYAEQIDSKENNVIDLILEDGRKLKIAIDSDVKISIPKLNKQLNKEVVKTEDKKPIKEKDKNSVKTTRKNNMSSKIIDFVYSAILKFVFATLSVLPQYLLVRYL